jgi:release factor glutamine methyltransferase
MPNDLGILAEMLSQAGFVAAEEEADELLACAGGDPERLESLVRRRLGGEPLAWITGSVSFCGLKIHVDAGVYVPRWQSEPLAARAVERLPASGTAIDLCTGSGAIARP